MLPDRIEVRIVLDPLLREEPEVGRGLEAFDRVVDPADSPVGAGGVVENDRLVGVDREGALDPLRGLVGLAELAQRRRAERPCARVVRVSGEVLFRGLDGFEDRGSDFRGLTDRSVARRQEVPGVVRLGRDR